MTEETNFKGKTAFKCLKCSFLYKDKKLAEKCENWCMNHNSCNIEIAKHAIKINQRR